METVVEPIRDRIFRSVEEVLAQLEGLDTPQLNTKPDIPESNSLWVIGLHTVSGTEQNVLQYVCGQTIERDRPAEFVAEAASPADVAALRERWQGVRQRISDGLAQVSEAELFRQRAHHIFDQIDGYGLLLEMQSHAANHAGEASLTRRLVTG